MTPHVLHVSRVGFLGGAERVVLTATQGLVGAGHRVSVACPGDGGLAAAALARGAGVLACEFDRMRVTADPRAWWRYLRVWRRASARVTDYCRRESVTILHAHHPVGVFYCLAAARRLGLPIVLHVHEMLPAKPLYALALRVAARAVTRFICVSAAARALLRTAGVSDAKVRTIPNGVDWGFIDDASPRERLEGPGPHIGVFGVLEPRKGQDVFLAAAERLLERLPQARFWIVGDLALKDKGAFARALHARAAGPRLAGRVGFVGHQARVAGWMRAMDVVVLPSVAHESMGMVLIEAMTLGRPAVCSAIGVTGEIVQDGRTGMLVPIGDADALADALAHLLTADPARRVEMGRLAAIDMRRRFSPADFCRRLGDEYRQLSTPLTREARR